MVKSIAALALAATLAGCMPYSPPVLAPVVQGPITQGPVAPGPTTPTPPAATADARAPVTILVSIDGFRSDYLERGATPVLSRLAAGGVSAPMRPSFPSKTFPNHWTLVTGLRPDRHGIVANNEEDPRRPGETFTMTTDDPFWWNDAEPIWVTAERAGVRTATMFWPGANVAWGGVRAAGGHGTMAGGIRPEDWQQFNQAVSGQQRVAAVVDWLRRPAATRPRFVTLYFDAVDSAGHAFGPDDPRTTAAVTEVDGEIGRLVGELAALGQPANLVIVADHGMAATSSMRTIALDRIAPPADYRVVESGPYATLVPTLGREAELAKALATRRDHMRCWPKAAIPARFHYGRNPRVPPWLCLADTGWLIVPTAPAQPFVGGNHGYDNEAPEMRALFIANGPAFAGGRRLPAFDNVDVAPLLRDLIGLPAGIGLDGDDRPFAGVLRR